MNTTSEPRREPAPSRAVAAAEAEIEQTRRHLDLALAAIRHDFALPIAAAVGVAAALNQAGDAKQLGAFVRRHAVPLGLIAAGAAWLAVQYRGALGEFGSTYAREFLDRARGIGARAAEAALSAAIEEIARPDHAAGAAPQPNAAATDPAPQG